MKKTVTLFLTTALLAATMAAAPKAAKKPKNFADLFGKNWTLQKATLNGKDKTADFVKGRMQGNVLVYTFSADGAMTTNEPDVISSDWKFNERGLNIHTNTKPPENVPAGQGYGGESTSFYEITKLTKDTLVLAVPLAKMTLTFKAK